MASSTHSGNGTPSILKLPVAIRPAPASPGQPHDAAEMTSHSDLACTVHEARLETALSKPEQARPTQRRQLSKEEWEVLKPFIHRVYINEGQSLKQVTHALGEHHDFLPTKKQLSTKLSDWGFRKNATRKGRPVAQSVGRVASRISTIPPKLPKEKVTASRAVSNNPLPQPLQNLDLHGFHVLRIPGPVRLEMVAHVGPAASMSLPELPSIDGWKAREEHQTGNDEVGRHHPPFPCRGEGFQGQDCPLLTSGDGSSDQWPVDIVGSPTLSRLFDALESESNYKAPSLDLSVLASIAKDQGDERFYISNSELVVMSSSCLSHGRQTYDSDPLEHAGWQNDLSGHPEKPRQTRVGFRFPQDVLNPSAIYLGSSPLNELSPFPNHVQSDQSPPITSVSKWKILEVESKERLSKLQPLLPQNHRIILDLMEFQAFATFETGNYRDAEPLYEKRIAIVQGTPESDSVETLRSSVILSRVRTGLWKYKETKAEQVHRKQVHARLSAILGPENRIVRTSLHNEAVRVGSTGNYEYREAIERQLAQMLMSSYGPRHPRTILALGNLLVPMQALGKHEQSERLLRYVLNFWSNSDDDWAPKNIILDMYALCDSLYKLGKSEELSKLSQVAAERAGSIYGLNHPLFFQANIHLAQGFRLQGREAEAENLLRRSFEEQAIVLADSHWMTVWTVHQLGILLFDLRRYEEAVPVLERAFRGIVNAVGPRYPDIFTAFEDLAKVYDSLGRRQDTQKLYEDALVAIRALMGDQHLAIVDRFHQWMAARSNG